MASTDHAGQRSTEPNPDENEVIANLEPRVQEGLEVLTSIENILQKYGESVDKSSKRVQNARAKASSPRVVIGIIGSTGAGKSSVINALLDTERLVPTSPMRACTAAVTEISYNHRDDFNYFAEIEFISKDEWTQELKVLQQDISDETSFSVPSSSGDSVSDAAAALSKVKAVYGYDRADTLECSVEDLAAHEKVSHLLGTTVKISENNAIRFYQAIKSKVESSEHKPRRGRPVSSSRLQLQPAEAVEQQVWPLIRVVRLYIKAPVLSTGVSIVDLPGMQDSNAARAKVAASYIEQCSALWIAAPITRAVDDNVASTLLGDAFKRQVQLDGSLGALTFICTKTDDINFTEVNESLGVLESYHEDLEAVDNAIESYESELQVLQGQKEEIVGDIDAIMERLDALDERQSGDDAAANGKRKRGNGEKEDDAADGEVMCLDSEGCDDIDNSAMSAQEDIENAKLYETQRRKEAVSRKRALNTQIEECRQQLDDAKTEKSRLDREFGPACIAYRNDYARTRIQSDFAEGIYNLDQENAAAQDADEVDTGVPVRDYDALAKSLNVFCVSAKAYQKLQGRLRRDQVVKGFDDLEQTEIPQLRKYCLQATETARVAAHRHFLNNLEQLLNSLTLQVAHNDGRSNLTQEKTEADTKVLNEQLELLHKALREAIKETMSTLSKEFEDLTLSKFGRAKTSASAASMKIVADWNKPKTENGLAWNTYQAICRRNGVYQKASTKYDWNVQLSQPLLTAIGPAWERLFQHATPDLLDKFVKTCKDHVKQFNMRIESHIQTQSAYAPFARSLKSQLRTYLRSLSKLRLDAMKTIKRNQKVAHRTVAPKVEESLRTSYLKAAGISGRGMYRVIKETMNQGVEESRWLMFHHSTDSVKVELEHMIASVHTKLETQVEAMFIIIEQDFRNIFEKSRTAENKALAGELSAFLHCVTMFQSNGTTWQQNDDGWPITAEPVALPAETSGKTVKMEDPGVGY